MIIFDDGVPTRSRVNLKICTASVDTRNFLCDFHLRTADYLDAKRFPTITFVSTHVMPVHSATYRVTGDLTIRGFTRTISLAVIQVEEATEDGKRRRRFAAETKIDRKHFGVDPGVAGLGFLIGNEVTVRVDLVAVEQRNSGSDFREEGHATHQ